MRILFISEFFPTTDLRYSGGVEARNYYVAKNLAKKHQVYVVTSRLPGSKKSEKYQRVNIYRVGPKRNYDASLGSFLTRIRFALAAITLGKSQNVDIVDGSNFLTHLIAKVISSSLKIPAVAWYPDVWIGSWTKIVGLKGAVGEVLERVNIRLGFDAYIAISNTKARILGKFVKKPISVIKCAVDHQEFKTHWAESKVPTILCVSRLVAYKRVGDLIWAFALLTCKIPNLKLVIIGRGPKKRELTNIVKMLKIGSKVTFLDNLPRKKLIKIMKSAHIFCLPSTVEGFGISIIESAAAQVPYVVSDIPVFREITKNGQGGVFFKAGDISDLAGRIEKLLINKKLYQTKARECTSLAKSYDWNQIADQTESLYKSLIQIPKRQ